MGSANSIRQDAGCEIAQQERLLRATVGPGLADEVQQCYRALAAECVVRQCQRVLVIGIATVDPFYHLACRDALRSLALAGVAPNFRLALVAKNASLIAVYDTAVVEARRLGLEARRFMTEEEASGWLEAT
jgi:hypothetical protein